MEKKSYKIVFVRHGESIWNKENRFTGWTDVPLSETGVAEGKDAGKKLKTAGYEFDVVFTSILKRAIMTWNLIAEVIDHHHVPVIKHWRLNERHYGSLQGLNKSETAKLHGEEQVQIWRRSYDIPPPPLALDKVMVDPKFKCLAPGVLPLNEVIS
jgi:2,3-bisphosphoglycerate-dependent phosphoglycerate mutase